MKDKLIKKIFKLIEEKPENWNFYGGDYVFARYNFDDGTRISVNPINFVNIMNIKVYDNDYRTIYEIGVPFFYFAMPFGWRRRMCRRLMKVYMDYVNNRIIDNIPLKEFEEKHLSDI